MSTEYANPAATAERIAVALVTGEVPAELIPLVRGELADANRAAQLARDVTALRAYRAGSPVWAWPAVAPWSGF